MEKRRKSPKILYSKKKRFPLSDNIEMQPRSPDNSSKSDEKSSFPSTLRHVSETSSEQASTSQIHYDSKRSDITEEQPESENVCESEKKSLSSSISEHGDLETSSDQASSQADDDRFPLSDNIEMQPRSPDNSSKSDEKSSFPSTLRHVSETSSEQASSSQIHYDSKRSDITEEQPESENVCDSEKKSLSSSISEHDDLETSSEQALSQADDDRMDMDIIKYKRLRRKQSDITEEQPESLNVCESEKKSFSISEHDDLDTSSEQALSQADDDGYYDLGTSSEHPSSSQADDDRKQADITEEQPESLNVCESETKSFSILEHDDLDTCGELASSSQADDDGKQSDITEEQPESLNVCESETKSFSILEHDDLDTSGELSSSSQADDDRYYDLGISSEHDSSSQAVDDSKRSDITEEQPESENVCESATKSFSILEHDDLDTCGELASSSPADDDSKSFQPDTTEKQSESESSNLDNLSEFDEISSFPFKQKQDVQKTSVEQASSNGEDHIRNVYFWEEYTSSSIKRLFESDEKSSSTSIPKQDVQETSVKQTSSQREDYICGPLPAIMEEQSESSNIKSLCESDEKSLSSSIPSQDLETPVEQDSSNREESISGPLPAIMEEQSESSNIKSLCESDEKSLSSSIPSQDLETPVEQDSSNREESISGPLPAIMEQQPESSNIKNLCESDEKSLSSSIPSQDLETPVEQDSSNREESISEPLQSDITERQPESSKIENVCESEKKSLSSSILSQDLETPVEQDSSNREESIRKQSDITEEQPESLNVCESETKSFSILKHDDLDTSGELTSSSQADDDRYYDLGPSSEHDSSSQADDDSEALQSDITERQPESSKIENVCESEKKSLSSSIPSQDLERPVEQDSSNREESISKRSDITEEQPESENVCESATKSFSILEHDDLDTCGELSSSNQADDDRYYDLGTSSEHASSSQADDDSETLQSDITERQPESSKIENVCESEKKSLSSSIPSQDLEIPVEQDSSNREESISEPLQSDIMERQPESSKIENVCESEKKPLSPPIPSQDLETPVEQISTSRIDKTSRGHILADYEECMKLMERSPIKVETNLSRLSFTEQSTESSDSDSVVTIIKRSTTSKFELELKVPSSEGCIQKSKSDTILTNNQYEKKEIPSIRDKVMSILKRYRSLSESSATEIAQPSTSKSALELKSQSSQECAQKNDSDNKSKENQDKCQVINTKALESTDLTANIHDNTSDLPASEPTDNQPKTTSDEKFEDAIEPIASVTEDRPQQDKINQPLGTVSDIVKYVPPKDKTIYKAPDEPEEFPHENKTGTQCRPNRCLIILSFIILLILSLFFLYYSRLLNANQNDKHTDHLKTVVVELEKMIFDQDNTVRALTKYLQQDTPLLKVVALVGDSIIDRSYTVDIMRKKLRRKNKNDPLPWLPDFIVIENLRGEHSKTVINYVETFQEAYNDRRFTILAVFTIEEMENDLKRRKEIYQTMKTINDTFIKADVNVKVIPYKLLTDTALDQYIINISKNIRQTFSQDEINNIKRYLIEDIPDCRKEYDC